MKIAISPYIPVKSPICEYEAPSSLRMAGRRGEKPRLDIWIAIIARITAATEIVQCRVRREVSLRAVIRRSSAYALLQKLRDLVAHPGGIPTSRIGHIGEYRQYRDAGTLQRELDEPVARR